MNSDLEEAELLAFLAQPLSYPDGCDSIERIETHAARVFLARGKAYKIKKRVSLAYLDFSTLERRHHALQRELEINAPHAPQLYLRVVPIVRNASGHLQFSGDGTVIDYALVMNRFDQDQVLARFIAAGPLSLPLCTELAHMVASYHQECPVAGDARGAARMQTTISQVAAGIRAAFYSTQQKIAGNAADQLVAAFDTLAPLLNERGRAGCVRRCHGDLHLENIVLLASGPTAFDALEFDEALATIDVLYDLAFLLMDLDFRGDRAAANRILNAYIEIAPIGNELEGLKALPAFLAARAAIRAVVAIERARQNVQGDAARDSQRAASYMALAGACLTPHTPVLIAIGGLSGTGKSTLASAIAPLINPSPGAVHLRSDVERKHLFGVPVTQRLTPDHYSAAISGEVYAALLKKAGRALAAGHPVIVDAVSAKPAERRALEDLATSTGVRFTGLWLDAPLDVKIDRVTARRGDASDAGSDVARAQEGYDLDAINWPRINAGGSFSHALDGAKAALARAGLL